MIERGNLLRKLGFYKTIDILPSDRSSIKMHEFYAILNKTDNYNTFLRVKSDLLEKKIIEIDYKHNVQYIGLTGNGFILKLRLKEIIEQIEKGIEG